jgi:hypothetical protein
MPPLAAIVSDGSADPQVEKQDQIILADRQRRFDLFLESDKPLIESVTRDVLSCVERGIQCHIDENKKKVYYINFFQEIPTWKMNYIRVYINSDRFQKLVDESLTSDEKNKFIVDTRTFNLNGSKELSTHVKQFDFLIKKIPPPVAQQPQHQDGESRCCVERDSPCDRFGNWLLFFGPPIMWFNIACLLLWVVGASLP